MNRLLLAAVLLVPAAASAQAPESAGAGAAERFAQSPAALRAQAAGETYAAVDLREALDKNLRVTNYRFGARPLDLGVATDAGFKKFFLTFSEREATTLGPLGDLNRLRGEGVDVRIDPATVYNFRVSINIFSPVRGSTLHMTPAQGTSGSAYDLSTGDLLDAIRARAALMSVGGDEYWVFYGRDALADGSGFAPTRSFLFVHMDGLSSKAWPLAESALTPDTPAVVDLGGTKVSVLLTPDRRLVVGSAD